MSPFRFRISSLALFLLAGLVLCKLPAGAPYAQETDTAPDVGVRFQPPASVLLTNAHIVVSANKQIDSGSLLIRNGKIAAIGTQIAPPAGVETIDCQGKYLYPAFVDAMIEMAAKPSEASTGYWNSNVTPQRKMADTLQFDKSQFETLRKAGVGLVLAAPNNGIIKGQSCVLSTADAPLAETLQQRESFQHIRLYPNRGGSESYPNSPMGATALVRQALLDADWYQRARQAVATSNALPLPAHSDALHALQPVVRAAQRVVIDGTNELYALRADRLAREFSLQLVIRGSGREYRQLSALAATNRTFIIPVNFPDAPKLDSESDMADATLQSLMHWRLAPENPGRLERAEVEFAITTSGLDKPTELLAKLRSAIAAGLSETKALQALTTAPAELLEVEHLVGSLETGKLANILITDGPLFAKATKIEETWVQGKRDRWQAELSVDPRGTWKLSSQDGSSELQLEIAGKADKLSAKIGLPAAFETKSQPADSDSTDTSVKANSTSENSGAAANQKKPLEVKALDFDGLQLKGTFQTQQIANQPEGQAWLNAVLLTAEHQLQAMHVNILWPDQSTTRYLAKRTEDEQHTATDTAAEKDSEADRKASSDQVERPPAPKPKPRDKAADAAPAGEKAEGQDKQQEDQAEPDEDKAHDPTSKPTQPGSEASQIVACEVNYPLGAYGRTAAPEQPELLLIKNATLWTCAEGGIIEGADMLVRRGIIEQVGQNLSVEADCVVVDASGLHVSPGIIDCHSHMATDGGINESGQAVTAEVRIGDFLDCNDITIYRQLAGGVTTSNILHGSANPIGGQNQVIKLRWGGLDEELKMREAPAGIKFALGENVKQSSRESSTRYPQTRMGVEQLLRDRFEAARDYRQRWRHGNQQSSSLPPRRDLELEAIAEVLEGDRWVHCHSYRQDEILMILSLLDDYDVTIGSLQHILEGYKVADAMAAHGATGSSFSDWWAYKFEVLDAIPYNGALMHRAGVVVSFNSDDAELARHLNHEAAKAVKYGGVEPSEALKFVTLNPAKQLRIDRWVGSLTPGKQADFVIWNRSPLSTLSMCMETWIDGRKYFDRAQDLQQRERDEHLRQQLIQSAVAQGAGKNASSDDSDPSLWWVRYDEFCHHGHDDHDDHHD